MLPFVLAVVYSGVRSPREGEIGFCDLMAFRQGKDCEAAGESKIFISLVCSNGHMLRWFLSWGSSRSAPPDILIVQNILNGHDYAELW